MDFNKEQLKQYSLIMEEWVPKEASIAIAAGDEYIYYLPGGHDLHVKEGQKIQTNSIADLVLKKACRTEAVLVDTSFQVPYYGIGYPIEINGERAALVVILPPHHAAVPITSPYKFLTGKQEDEWKPIPIEKVSHIESLQKKTWFYANKEPYKTSIPLKDLQLRLPDSFLRIHRSYIVNISFIDRIVRDFSSNLLVQLLDGTELPVSQSYMADVRGALGF
ncbi:LytTR family DNA-binding domain-containing protein [Psychrobacillus sp. INOP01]|uniref:LytR/AlgR family response regulator transcription factor n=1 Tax=Psychrobacillus sp. INOP01 TaxID=2829187 RepID=UPI001F45203F|nr:LytTR family DNA-binding domain-containing protein [Psychrobacillus sp. INOP01]